MSHRPEPWWRAPLRQWQREVEPALIDCWSLDPAIITPVQLAHIITDLADLSDKLTTSQSMGQLFRQHDRPVPSIKIRRARRRAAPSNRKLLQPLLPALQFGDDLRPQRLVRHTITPHEKQRRALIDQLSAEQLQRIGAAGYLSLISVLAFRRAGAVVNDRECAHVVAEEVLRASVWLYGKPRFKLATSLVAAITANGLSGSSIRRQAQRLLVH
jgi:hypothetical protein